MKSMNMETKKKTGRPSKQKEYEKRVLIKLSKQEKKKNDIYKHT